jgi:signal transduction histidine kinase
VKLFARLTIRARLTLVYGGLFLLAGVVMLGVTYALVAQRLPAGNFVISGGGPRPSPDVLIPGSAPDPQVTNIVGSAWNQALTQLVIQGGIALALVSTAAIAFGWLLAGHLLRPLHRVTETARRIATAPAADRGLHERIALDGPDDEIRELADTFDGMLARLDRAFDGQRRFIANASHELRTPLTVNRSLLEVALYRTAATPELRQLGETLLEMNARQERLLDGLLVLARSEREVTDRSYVDLADIVDHVTTQVPSGSVAVRAEAAEAPTMGNPALLERLVHNLVDNGVRHNVPDGGWVRVSTAAGSDSVELCVSNSGPVVPRYEIPGLFEPFRRLAADRVATASPGAGLGLSVVAAVARAHGGAVRAEPRDGGGLTVTVSLPRAS